MRALVLMLALAYSGHAADIPAAWANVAFIPRDREVSVVLSSGPLVVGKVVESSAETIRVKSGKEEFHLYYSQIVRISEGPIAAERDTVYSGRSSWMDAFLVFPALRERLIIVTKAGREILEFKPGADASGVRIRDQHVPKSDVLKVIYLRYRPITATELRLHKVHLDFLAPRLRSDYAGIGLMEVPLYEATQPEDNTLVSCRSAH